MVELLDELAPIDLSYSESIQTESLSSGSIVNPDSTKKHDNRRNILFIIGKKEKNKDNVGCLIDIIEPKNKYLQKTIYAPEKVSGIKFSCVISAIKKDNIIFCFCSTISIFVDVYRTIMKKYSCFDSYGILSLSKQIPELIIKPKNIEQDDEITPKIIAEAFQTTLSLIYVKIGIKCPVYMFIFGLKEEEYLFLSQVNQLVYPLFTDFKMFVFLRTEKIRVDHFIRLSTIFEIAVVLPEDKIQRINLSSTIDSSELLKDTLKEIYKQTEDMSDDDPSWNDKFTQISFATRVLFGKDTMPWNFVVSTTVEHKELSESFLILRDNNVTYSLDKEPATLLMLLFSYESKEIFLFGSEYIGTSLILCSDVRSYRAFKYKGSTTITTVVLGSSVLVMLESTIEKNEEISTEQTQIIFDHNSRPIKNYCKTKYDKETINQVLYTHVTCRKELVSANINGLFHLGNENLCYVEKKTEMYKKTRSHYFSNVFQECIIYGSAKFNLTLTKRDRDNTTLIVTHIGIQATLKQKNKADKSSILPVTSKTSHTELQFVKISNKSFIESGFAKSPKTIKNLDTITYINDLLIFQLLETMYIRLVMEQIYKNNVYIVGFVPYSEAVSPKNGYLLFVKVSKKDVSGELKFKIKTKIYCLHTNTVYVSNVTVESCNSKSFVCASMALSGKDLIITVDFRSPEGLSLNRQNLGIHVFKNVISEIHEYRVVDKWAFISYGNCENKHKDQCIFEYPKIYLENMSHSNFCTFIIGTSRTKIRVPAIIKSNNKKLFTLSSSANLTGHYFYE